MKQDYQKELDILLSNLSETHLSPKLFLHSCCAPCSSHCLSVLAPYFDITVFYYNPNITDSSEYNKRLSEQERLVQELQLPRKCSFQEGRYNPESFLQIAKGLENLPEGQERCMRCYELRLRETAVEAQNCKADYFGTTLSVSPYKNAQSLYEIGNKIGQELGIQFLPADFKKRGGYLHSIELSRQYNLYRQPYCGCIYSQRQMELRKLQNNKSISQS